MKIKIDYLNILKRTFAVKEQEKTFPKKFLVYTDADVVIVSGGFG
jgi:hypothetical protein